MSKHYFDTKIYAFTLNNRFCCGVFLKGDGKGGFYNNGVRLCNEAEAINAVRLYDSLGVIDSFTVIDSIGSPVEFTLQDKVMSLHGLFKPSQLKPIRAMRDFEVQPIKIRPEVLPTRVRPDIKPISRKSFTEKIKELIP